LFQLFWIYKIGARYLRALADMSAASQKLTNKNYRAEQSLLGMIFNVWKLSD
jgi:hypothetical protein